MRAETFRLLNALLLATLAAARVGAGEANPFEAMAAGRVRSSVCRRVGEAGGALSSMEALRAGSAGRGTAALRADGSFTIEGVSIGVPVRALATLACGSGGPGDSRLVLASEPVTLSAANGFSARADVRSGGLAHPLIADLDATGPGGERTIVLPNQGVKAALSVSGALVPGGPPVPVLGPGGNPALTVSSSNLAVAVVSPAGEVTAVGPGLARITVAGDGGWAQVLAQIDLTADTDGDGMPDSFEIANGFLPLDPADGALDVDGDGLSNRDEYIYRTNPRAADTDNDQLSDSTEVFLRGTDPLNADSDGDTTTDGAEVSANTDPLNPNERPGPAFTPVLRDTEILNPTGVRAAAYSIDYVFLITTDGRIASYSIEIPLHNPVNRDFENLSADLRDIAVEGNTAYVAAGATGIHVVDLTNPAVLARTNTVAGLGTVNGVVVRKGVVFLATDLGLRILRARPAGGFDNLGSLAVPSFSRFTVIGGLAYLGVPGINRLISADVSDLAAPRELQRFAMPASTAPFRAVEASSNYVYVAHGSAGLVVLSAADPAALQVIDSTATEFPGGAFDALSISGNQLHAHTPAANNRVQLYRARDDGRIDRLGDVAANATGSTQLIGNQNYLASFIAGSFSIAEVLPRADRAGAPPAGILLLEEERNVFAPGQEFSVGARARDDVYVESVEFFLNGKLVGRDSLPPFRLVHRLAATPVPPYDLEVRAVGMDLQRNEGPIGTVLVRVRADLDGDGAPDEADLDQDADGVADLEERFPGADGFVSDPRLRDTDGDGIGDGEEAIPGSDGHVTDAGSRDTDGDGLDDPYEIGLLHTDPARADSDGDGVLDGDEDNDADGLANRDEALLGSNPAVPDTDGDGLTDGIERDLGLDPTRADTDGDGIADGAEDFDGDELPNAVEIANGTNPLAADTDGDGFDDATEGLIGTSPTEPTDFSGRSLTFTSRTVTLRGPVALGSLTLVSSTLRPEAPVGRAVAAVQLTVSGALSIDAASAIDASGRGYPGGRGPGNASHLGLGPEGLPPGDPLAGGSHGGLGGYEDLASGTEAQPAHGNLADPALAGGGGSASSGGSARGGSGGGVIRIRAGSLALNGAVLADGEGAPAITAAGAGAGGSIRIECGSLTGTGKIQAGGGAASSAGGRHPGGGGGGRIAVLYGNSTFDFARVTARGGGLAPAAAFPGSAGGAGTVFLRSGASARGELIIENGGLVQDAPRTPLLGVGEGTIADLGDDYLIRLEGDFPPDVAGLELDPDVEDDQVEAFTVFASEGDRLYTAPGLLASTSAGARFRGLYRFDRLTVRGAAAVASDATLALLGAQEPLRLSGDAFLAAPEVVLLGTANLTIADSELAADELRGPVGTFSILNLRNARLVFFEPLETGVLTLESSHVEAGGPISAGRLELHDTVLTVPAASAGGHRVLDLVIDSTFSVDAASAIDLTGKGYAGGYAAGNDGSGGETPAGFAGEPGTGGSHGGRGGVPSAGGAPAQVGYGDPLTPDFPGAGGSTFAVADPELAEHRGGNGGGVAKIIAGTFVLDGVLEVSGAASSGPDGGTSPSAGAGAGGSVRVAVTTWRGAGAIIAAGGASFPAGGQHAGAGGGGRIAVIYGDRSGFTGALHAPGGAVNGVAGAPGAGGAGTIFTRQVAAPLGELEIDAESVSTRGYSTFIPDGGEGPLAIERLLVRGGARLESARGLEVAALDPGSADRFTVEGFLRAPFLSLPAVAFLEVRNGELDAAQVVAGGAGIGSLTATASRVVLSSPFRAGGLVLAGASTLTVPDPGAGRAHALEVELTGTFSIEVGSVIDLAGKGYVGGGRGGNASRMGETADHVVLAVGGRTGGGHGAIGGFQAAGTGLGTPTAPVYDDLRDPRRPGGGGSAKLDVPAELGYSGGGLARLRARELVLAGRITVEGDGRQRAGNMDLGGAGGGGGIRIDVELLRGAGELSADGGHADGGVGAGAGGGGRIAIYYVDRSGFTGTVHAFGGALVPEVVKPTSVGGAGTVYWKGASQGYGDLVLDNAFRAQSTSRTQLRRVGSGTITSMGPTFLTAVGPFPTSDTRLTGQWVVVKGSTLTPFPIVTNTANMISTDPASGTVTSVGAAGDPYQGAIVLDNLTVRRNAAFNTQTDLIIITTGASTVTEGGSLTAPPVVHW